MSEIFISIIKLKSECNDLLKSKYSIVRLFGKLRLKYYNNKIAKSLSTLTSITSDFLIKYAVFINSFQEEIESEFAVVNFGTNKYQLSKNVFLVNEMIIKIMNDKIEVRYVYNSKNVHLRKNFRVTKNFENEIKNNDYILNSLKDNIIKDISTYLSERN